MIEDTAWGCGAKFKQNYLGTWGDIGAFHSILPKQLQLEKEECYYESKENLKAKAWHDHGHENNPRVPRWEDTRKSSGFNLE